MARRSSHITSRLESGSLGRSRFICVSHPQRRRWCRWQRGRSQGVDFETRSCYFVGIVDHTIARDGRSLRAIGACGVEDPRLEVKPCGRWLDGRHRPNSERRGLTSYCRRTARGRARPAPAVRRPLGGPGGRLGRAFPPRRTRVLNRDRGYTRVVERNRRP